MSIEEDSSLRIVFLKMMATMIAITIPSMYMRNTTVPAKAGKKTPAIRM
jgi:hypothetical protein